MRGSNALAADDWLLVHCVHLDRPLPRHDRPQPALNMNNAVGYAAPTTRPNRVVLGTDGIGADMLEEARLAYVRLREHDVHGRPDTVWSWLEEGYRFFPECRDDRVEWNYDHADSAWHVAFTPGRACRRRRRSAPARSCVRDGRPTRVDLDEVRAKAAEQAARLFARL